MHAPEEYLVLSKVVPRSRKIAAPVRRAIIESAVSSYQALAKVRNKSVDHTVVLLNAILSSDISHSMEVWTKQLVEGVPTVYDKAMDAAYNVNDIGGGQLQRLFDGSHTLLGTWDKARNALPNDSFVQETMGYFSALWHDLGTHVGLPLVTLDKTNYDFAANFLKDNFNIPKSRFQDILHVNGVEVFGASIGAVAIVYQWKRKDVKRFSALCGSLGISALISANPALGVLVLAALAKSFMDARHQGDGYDEVLKGLAKGGIGTGLVWGTATLIPGPALVGLLAGMCVGIAAYKALNAIQLSEVSSFVVSSVKARLPAYSVTGVG